MFPAMGRSFQSLLDYEEEDFEENFGLNFTVSLACLCVCVSVFILYGHVYIV